MEEKLGGFNTSAFKELFEKEEKSFWFNARNKLIIYFIRKYFPAMKDYLEIGCGTGFVLKGISESFPECNVTGTELFEEGLEYARIRVPSAKFIQLDAVNIKPNENYDVFGVFDVLEHIKEDEKVLENLHFIIRNSTMQNNRGGGAYYCTSAYVYVEFYGRRSLPCKTIFPKRTSYKARGSWIQSGTHNGICVSAFSLYAGFKIFERKSEKRERRAKSSFIDEYNFCFYHACGILSDSFRNKLPVWRKHYCCSHKIGGNTRWACV